MTIIYRVRKVSSDWMRVGAASLLIAASVIGTSGMAVAQDATVVEMTDELEFGPEMVTISVGDTVEWRNTSGAVHTATADTDKAADPANVSLPEGAEAFDSGSIAPGETYSHTFDVAGRY